MNQNSGEKYKPFLEKWIATCVNARSWEYFEDLHLDEIDSELVEKSIWVSESFKIHATILELVEKLYKYFIKIYNKYFNIFYIIFNIKHPYLYFLI